LKKKINKKILIHYRNLSYKRERERDRERERETMRCSKISWRLGRIYWTQIRWKHICGFCPYVQISVCTVFKFCWIFVGYYFGPIEWESNEGLDWSRHKLWQWNRPNRRFTRFFPVVRFLSWFMCSPVFRSNRAGN
jgi:hypothetical protein